MAPEKIKLSTLLQSALLILAVETLLWLAATRQILQPLLLVGIARLIETAGILFFIGFSQDGFNKIGLAPGAWIKGMRKGAVWSIVFAIIAIAGMGVIWIAGQNPFLLLRIPLPENPVDQVLLFAVVGLIAPFAEEICFRGLLYTYLRRWGIVFALVISTTAFVIPHAAKIPVTQIVGGVVFALSYEKTRSLMTPVVIHVTGNLALFSLSFITI
ncbi:MAG: CPBP family intramembrane metalloprotease [Desulfobacteraceae bacterium]|nr:CPBP family intramembrane metalloprotease [Desulfobacteraceae bacterium]